jgi:Multiubiquitin
MEITRMSDNVDEANKGKRVFHATIDDKNYDFSEPIVTGAQLKATAGIDPSYQLIREAHGHEPNTPIKDADKIDLSSGGRAKFFSAPPATYGIGGLFSE